MELELKTGEYHSDLCPYYEEEENHNTSSCPNTIKYTPEHVETNFVLLGFDAYIGYGVSAEISYDYMRVGQRLIEIWKE